MIGKKKKEKEQKQSLLKRIFYKLYNSKLGIKVRNLADWLHERIEKSIRFEIIVVFLICFVSSFFFYGFAKGILSREVTTSNLEYDVESIKENVIYLRNDLTESSYSYDENKGINSLEDKEKINEVLNRYKSDNRKIYITDLDGKILYNVNGEYQDKIDIYSVMDKSNSISDVSAERAFIYPIKLGEDRAYLIYYGIPTPYISYNNYTTENSFLALILSVIIFIAVFIIITNKKMRYIEEIAQGVRIISNGDLSYRINERGKDEIKFLAQDINNMAEEIQNRIEAERKAEKTKSELITNVSHDLRTPLTSVMGYIGLIKEGKYENEETMKEYLNVAFNKANQLKVLIEDLFEYTKLNNNGITLEKTKLNIIEFLSQIIEEYVPIFEENNLNLEKKFLDDKAMVEIDPVKMVRVFENLFSNAIKYSVKPGDVKISQYIEGNYCIISIRNKGEYIPKEKVERLFDRFYRVDEARNSNIKGSGLGLAISKNIVDLHKGMIFAKSNENEITFFVKLKIIE